MDINERIIREEFAPMCQAFDLVVQKVGDGHIALIGVAFLLLVWSDREGVSVKYVRSASSKYLAIDLGRFVALKRGWAVSNVPGENENTEDRLRRECAAYALNLQKYAEDILQGEVDWMKQVAGSPSELSNLTSEAIKAAIERSGAI